MKIPRTRWLPGSIRREIEDMRLNNAELRRAVHELEAQLDRIVNYLTESAGPQLPARPTLWLVGDDGA